MFPAPFGYVRAESLDEALAVLAREGPGAKILAGGQSLLPMMKLRIAEPALLVDIHRLPALTGWQETAEGLTLGAVVRHSQLERAEALQEFYPLLGRTARWIADPLVRNRGTVAGSLAHADPAGDWGAALLALGASVTLRSLTRTRELPLDAFLVDIFTTALEPDEVLTAIRIPKPAGRPFGTYLKLERKVGDFAVVGVAVNVVLDARHTVVEAGIGLAGVGPRALRAPAAEAALIGHPLESGGIREAAALAAEAADPVSDRRGSRAYKRNVVRVFVERGLKALADESRPEVGVTA
ncbi:MAG: xanthine dehydrogenase family protein subunit M [Firmicutes bacterium]|nr:xanthine dehydrogenase family protein subunit M [Alicyclobacillaceae bacterium]MCL6496449.1 xanthine dehydrogenase family protein subunit M [Bacillota bacterium]